MHSYVHRVQTGIACLPRPRPGSPAFTPSIPRPRPGPRPAFTPPLIMVYGAICTIPACTVYQETLTKGKVWLKSSNIKL